MSIVRVLLALLLLLPISAQAQTPPKFPALTGRVVDDAHLLSADQAAQLTQLSADVEKASSRQLVVATIPDLQGYDIADYGYQLGRAWGIGQKGANNGIILIVAPKERKVRIEVGYGLEPIMTDGLSSTIINDTILPHFRQDDMAGGIVAGAQAIAGQLKLPLEAAEQRAQQQQVQKTTQTRHRSSRGGVPIGLIFWGIVLAFILVPMFLGGRRQSRRGPWGARRYSDGGSALPIILWTIANEIGRESSRGGGWGGGAGGGGWGGGDSGGGGGGGFSGGGGSFGGGGASGSW